MKRLDYIDRVKGLLIISAQVSDLDFEVEFIV